MGYIRTIIALLVLAGAAQAQEAAEPSAGIMAELAILAGAEARLVYNPLSCCDWGGSCVFPTVETAAAE